MRITMHLLLLVKVEVMLLLLLVVVTLEVKLLVVVIRFPSRVLLSSEGEVWMRRTCPVRSHFHTGAEIGRGSGRRQTISSAALFSQPRNFVLLLLLTMMLAAVGRRRRGRGGGGGGRRCCATANIVITGTGSGRRVEVVQERAEGRSTDIQRRVGAELPYAIQLSWTWHLEIAICNQLCLGCSVE